MLKKVKDTTTLYEQVVEQIKSMIVQGIYKKGDLLPSEKELMQLTGVSRITVREALKKLSELGIIDTRKGKGSFVIVDQDKLMTNANDQEKQLEYQKFFVASSKARLVLEAGIAKEAAKNANQDDIDLIEKTLHLKHGKQSVELPDFHFAITKATHNPILIDIMDSILKKEAELEIKNQPLFKLIPPENQKSTASELAKQHKKIYEAIKNHNPEFAYFYMMEHMEYLMHSYEEYFEWFLS